MTSLPSPASVRLIITLALLAQADIAPAGSVFRCIENGKTTFSETATGPACQPLAIKEAPPPDPKAVARQQRELEEWSRQRDFEVQNIQRREAIARSEELKARLQALGPARAPGVGAKARARQRGAAAGGRAAVVRAAAAPAFGSSRASVGGGK
jgi:hypothetical protein